jgi:hypothetical protein
LKHISTLVKYFLIALLFPNWNVYPQLSSISSTTPLFPKWNKYQQMWSISPITHQFPNWNICPQLW